ncbi:hypothetical protein [Nocardia sp. A7]|uniref:hypothetical protein n=1 Tax=Nocardia sp. A7 TaxID=2789274 RepID=UPI0039796F80
MDRLWIGAGTLRFVQVGELWPGVNLGAFTGGRTDPEPGAVLALDDGQSMLGGILEDRLRQHRLCRDCQECLERPHRVSELGVIHAKHRLAWVDPTEEDKRDSVVVESIVTPCGHLLLELGEAHRRRHAKPRTVRLLCVREVQAEQRLTNVVEDQNAFGPDVALAGEL